MNRRNFLKSSVVVASASIGPSQIPVAYEKEYAVVVNHSQAMETTIVLRGIDSSLKILQISDSHISCDAEIDRPYEKYSARMNAAYKEVRHYLTDETTTTLALFKELMQFAIDQQPDLIVLTGDIVNYPSSTAIEFVKNEIDTTGIPFIYCAGNHDWDYEGMEGDMNFLRDKWISRRLKPLYNGRNPYFSSTIINDVNIVVLDNSTYQINQEQLAFWIAQKSKRYPIVLFVHIPLYMPTMRLATCGHPERGGGTEPGSGVQIAKNDDSTIKFINDIMSSNKIAGVFAGHFHNHHTIAYNKITQHIAFPAFSGQYRMINIVPMK